MKQESVKQPADVIQPVPFPAVPREQRLMSLDIVRGLTVLVMLFVNDLAGVAGVPRWMKHIQPPAADGMTFVDVVFPAFLFIVGLAMPLALERRFAQGNSVFEVARHLVLRAGSLLIIGVLMVNSDNMSDRGWINPAVWVLLVYLGVCLVWMNLPGIGWRRWVRVAGLLLLLALGVAFRGSGETALIELRTSWWGILGLIGWAYLVTGLVYLAARKNNLVLAAAVPLLYCVYFADRAGFFTRLSALDSLVDFGSMLGSHAAITASGALLGITLVAPVRSDRSRLVQALLLGGTFAASGLMLHSLHHLHPMFFYNKIAATAPWCLLSSAFTAWIWAAAYWLTEVAGVRKGTGWLAAAGQNALFAFILGPIAYTFLGLFEKAFPGGSPWSRLGTQFSTGLFRSLAFAVVATWVTAFLQRRRLTLKL